MHLVYCEQGGWRAGSGEFVTRELLTEITERCMSVKKTPRERERKEAIYREL